MSEKQKIIRVFIGSPGGLESERQAAHDAVNSVNRSHSDHWGLQIRLLGWETALPGFVRPQDKINEDLDRCDYFIGVLWNHWGSKPTVDHNGPTSGFEEEYKRAEERVQLGLMRDMALFFKTVAIPSGFIPDENIQKVLDFRARCIAEKRHFFKDFDDQGSFREMVREKLEEIGWKETEIFNQPLVGVDQSTSSSDIDNSSNSNSHEGEMLLSENARSFVSDLVQRPSSWESTSSTDVARLRLLGVALKRSGNDDQYLGNHDANLLFQSFRDSELSEQEIRALIDCGVVSFQHSNVPLWTWIAKEDERTSQWRHLKVLATFGTNLEKKNALDILRLLEASMPSFGEGYDEEKVLQSWLSEDVHSSVFNAAISFISKCATNRDLPIIEGIAEKSSPHHRSKIEAGILGIIARINVNAALQRAVENDVDNVDAQVAKALFSSPQSITTEVAVLCLSAKPDLIRLNAIQLLVTRNELSLNAAQTLLTDTNHEIRLIAAETLRAGGQPLRDEIVRKALRIVKPTNLLFGYGKAQTDETFYERYLLGEYNNLTYDQLIGKLDSGTVIEHRAMAALLYRHGAKAKSFISENLKDLFHTYFERRIKRGLEVGELTENMVQEVRGLEEVIKNRLCSIAILSIAEQADKKDLALVRSVLDNASIDANEPILKYLGRFGDWTDIERIKGLGNRGTRSLSLFDFAKTPLPDDKAAAILEIGRTRVADTLSLELSSEIRIALAKKLPKSVLVGLRDEVLIRELERPLDDYRIVFAIRCVQTLPKSRLKIILGRYLDSVEHRFYNSIHWLDLGVALPSNVAKKVAQGALERY